MCFKRVLIVGEVVELQRFLEKIKGSNCGPDAKPDLDTFWPVDVVALNQEFASIVVYRRESVGPSSTIICIKSRGSLLYSRQIHLHNKTMSQEKYLQHAQWLFTINQRSNLE